MSYDYLTVERGGPVARVVFDRKARLNALDAQSLRELTDVARSFHDDTETQAVVLSGSPKAFSAGVDLKERATRNIEQVSDTAQRHIFGAGGRMCKAWEEMPQATIAAIEGMAVGGGVALAIALDWRIMSKSAFMYVPELKVGLNLQWGALPRLIALVGPARAKRICILCEKLPSRQALDWGLAEEVVPDGTSSDAAMEMARLAASMPEAAMRMIKEGVNATAGALFRAASFSDFDQSQLASRLGAAGKAVTDFSSKK